ncbi:MAG TPA: slipin family protein [Gemmatimonadaceae bacterium]|nr:slipin family protein [Gemmatimonadaceae bacterium]
MEILYAIAVAAGLYVLTGLRVLKQYERGVMFVLGRYTATRGPGLVFVPPIFASMRRVSLRIVALDIPAQDVITRDNISVKVNAVLYFRVMEPSLAIIEIQDYLYATGQLAQTTLLSVLGQVELDELLADRRKVNDILKQIIDERTDFWGVEVSAVEIKDVLLPDTMRRAIARQAEAERERRAKVISAQGELQASETLAEAARVLQAQPASIQLRYLQTLAEIATENNSTTIFPLPIDILRPFVQRAEGAGASAALTASPEADTGAEDAQLPAPRAADRAIPHAPATDQLNPPPDDVRAKRPSATGARTAT